MESQYQAAAFFTTTGSKRHTGQLHMDPSCLRFSQKENQLTLPYAGLTIRQGGAANRLIFFRHPDYPEVEIFTSDLAVLRDPILQGHTELHSQLKNVRTARLSTKAVTLGVIGAILLAIGLLFAFRGVLVQAVVAQIPTSFEKELGEQVFHQVTKNNKEVESPVLVAQTNALLQPLLDAIPDKRYTFTLHVVDNSTVNAFALPGGIIAIHTGLLLNAKSPEELMGVIAHEVAHVRRRHAMQNIVGSTGLFLLIETFFGDATGLLAVALDNSNLLLNRKFSRDFEREADALAWDTLKRANVDPRGIIHFFDRLHNMQEKNSVDDLLETAFALWSTHPITTERLEYLREWENELQTDAQYTNHKETWAALQEALQAIREPASKGGE